MTTPQAAEQHKLVQDFRTTVLTWIGIVGTVLTIFSKFRALLEVADWALWVINKLDQWSHAFWTTLVLFLGIQLDPTLVPLLSFLLFIILTAAGAAISTLRRAHPDHSDSPVLVLTRIGHCVAAIAIILLALVPFGLPSLTDRILFYVLSLPPALVSAVFWSLPALPLLFVNRSRDMLVSIAILLIMFFLIVVFPMEEVRQLELIQAIPNNDLVAVRTIRFDGPVFWLSIILILALAPLKAVTQRLIFIVCGVAVLIGLNELSKLGLASYLKTPRTSS